MLARINNLDLLARTVVDGFINGIHKSPYFGVSLDFAEHRGYVPGDDIRRVDWKLYARTDRYYVKQYEADSNANFAVLLDISKSMRFASSGLSKLEYAKYLAASLTYFAHRQRDRVGLATFDDDIVDHVPCSAKHLDVALHVIDRATAGRPGHLERPLKKAGEHFGRRGLLAIVSDLYEEPDVVLDLVKPLRYRGHDVMVFHILDPAEVEFPFEEASAFEDLESGDQMPVVPSALADQYRALIREHIDALTTKFTQERIDYAFLNTSLPLDHALFSFLSARERLSRVR